MLKKREEENEINLESGLVGYLGWWREPESEGGKRASSKLQFRLMFVFEVVEREREKAKSWRYRRD